MGNIDINKILMHMSAFIVAGSIHEFAHAFSAYKLGDDTAKAQKRLSVNPLYHVDIFGTILLPLISIFSNLPLFGWMRPVPINVLKLKSRRGMKEAVAIVSFAGPYANLLQGILSFLILKIAYSYMPSDPHPSYFAALSFIHSYCYINLVLMIFNLLPLPPLDGGGVASYFLSLVVKDYKRKEKIENRFAFLHRYGFIILYILAFSGLLAFALRFLVGGIYSLLNMLSIGLMAILLGICLIPFFIFIFYTTKDRNHFRPSSSVSYGTKKIYKSKIKEEAEVTSNTYNSSAAQEARALYHRLMAGELFNKSEDGHIIQNYKKELPPLSKGQCASEDFKESDSYCKKCNLFGHCLLRAIDKIAKFK